MNLDKLKRLVGSRVRLRPKVKSCNEQGSSVDVDDEWLPEAVEAKTGVRLVNCRTGHIARLNYDHIHHFISAPQQADGIVRGFLEIHVSLELKGNEVELEPILSGAGRIRTLDSKEESRIRFLAIIVQHRLQMQQLPNRLRDVWHRGLVSMMEAGTDYVGRLDAEKRIELECRLREYGTIEEAELFQLSSFDVLDDRTIADADARQRGSQQFLFAHLQRLADLVQVVD